MLPEFPSFRIRTKTASADASTASKDTVSNKSDSAGDDSDNSNEWVSTSKPVVSHSSVTSALELAATGTSDSSSSSWCVPPPM